MKKLVYFVLYICCSGASNVLAADKKTYIVKLTDYYPYSLLAKMKP